MDKFGWTLADVTIYNEDESKMQPTRAMQAEIDEPRAPLPPMEIPEADETLNS